MTNGRGRVLITGASRGIGSAIARSLLEAGYEVYGTSRNPDGIPAGCRIPGVSYLALEMTNLQSIDRLVERIGTVDVLIHNAGASQIGPVEEASPQLVLYLYNLNLIGIIYLTRRLLPGMRQRSGGTIIHISSLAGRIIVPFSTIYASTKHGLDGYAKGLRAEVKQFGIKVVNVCPFGIRTGIAPMTHYGDHSPYLSEILRITGFRNATKRRAPGPEIVARKVKKVLEKKNPRFSYVVGGIAPVLSLLERIVPQKLAEIIYRKIFRLD